MNKLNTINKTYSLKNKLVVVGIAVLCVILTAFVALMTGCSEKNILADINRTTDGSVQTPEWLANYDNQSTFEISNNKQLIELSQFVNGTFDKKGNFENKRVFLIDNITFNENCCATNSCMDDAYEFWAIGDSSCDGSNWFAGEFDGNGYTISGLYGKTESHANTLGFFAGLKTGANIHDIIIDNSFYESVKEEVPVSLIASTKDCNSTGTNSTVANSSNENSTSTVQSSDIKISNIYINDNVYFNAVNDAGGIVAKADSTKSNLIFDSCVFKGVSKSTYQDTKVSSKTGKITFQSNSGGIIGNCNNTPTKISNCLSIGFIMGGTDCSGIVGCADGSLNVNSCIDASTLQCGSASYGYRLYGGKSDKAVNSQATLTNCIYLQGDNNSRNSSTTTTSSTYNTENCKTSSPSLNNLIIASEGKVNPSNGILSEKSNNIDLVRANTIDEIKAYKDNITSCTALGQMSNAAQWQATWSTGDNYKDVIVPNKFKGIHKTSFCTDPISIDYVKVTQNNSEFIPSLSYVLSIDKNYILNSKSNMSINGVVPTVDDYEAGIYYYNGKIERTIRAEKTGETESTVIATAIIEDIKQEDYNTTYSVVPFATVKGATFKGEAMQSNNLADVAWAMLTDLSPTQSQLYNNVVTDGTFDYKYSPYTNEQRQQLYNLIQEKPIKTSNNDAQTATPESVGISSEEIVGLMKDMEERGLRTHTMMIQRHGKTIVEKYADGYDKNSLQRMYSVSKSVVGISMSILLSDSNYDVKLTDPVGKYFPEYSDCDPIIYNTTIEQCLKMSTPFSHGVYEVGDKSNNNWVESFFRSEIDKNPNDNEFWYDTCGSYVVGVIVERVTGKDFLTYAKDKAFSQCGMTNDVWCVNAPEGYPWGGSGCMFTTQNLMDVGNLMLAQGNYKGQQLVAQEYSINATSNLIDDSEEGYSTQDGRGYGYYTWITDFGFAYLGMGNQIYCAIPALDMAFVCTSDNQGNGQGYFDLFELISRRLVAGASYSALPENDAAVKELNDYQLKLPTQKGNSNSALTNKINGKTFTGGEDGKITDFKLDINAGKLTYTCHGQEKTLDFAIGSNKFGILDETEYSWKTINKPMTEDGRNQGYRTACSGAWKDDNTFVILVQVVDDYLANMTMTFKFNDNGDCAILTNKYTAEGFLKEYKMTDAKFESN